MPASAITRQKQLSSPSRGADPHALGPKPSPGLEPALLRNVANGAPATFYVVTGGVDIYWRCLSPAAVVGANVVQIPGELATEFLVSKPASVYAGHEGIGVWTRPDAVRAKHAIQMEEYGLSTCAEMDDNYLSRAHLNLFMRENAVTKRAQEIHLRAMSCFQRNVFSTAWLRDRYHKAFKQLGQVPELFVCRNHVNLDDILEPIESDRLRVGWMGSAQHARDIKLVSESMAWARGAGHEVVHMGHDPRASKGVTNPKALDTCLAWAAIITRQIPWVDPELYHRQALPIDIGLAPLERNDHTLGKSDVKWLEYTMSGAATIASSGTVYGDIKHGETGILAGSPAEFLHWTKRLCRDRRLREELARNAQEWVRANRTMQVQGVEEWGAALAK